MTAGPFERRAARAAAPRYASGSIPSSRSIRVSAMSGRPSRAVGSSPRIRIDESDAEPFALEAPRAIERILPFHVGFDLDRPEGSERHPGIDHLRLYPAARRIQETEGGSKRDPPAGEPDELFDVARTLERLPEIPAIELRHLVAADDEARRGAGGDGPRLRKRKPPRGGGGSLPGAAPFRDSGNDHLERQAPTGGGGHAGRATPNPARGGAPGSPARNSGRNDGRGGHASKRGPRSANVVLDHPVMHLLRGLDVFARGLLVDLLPRPVGARHPIAKPLRERGPVLGAGPVVRRDLAFAARPVARAGFGMVLRAVRPGSLSFVSPSRPSSPQCSSPTRGPAPPARSSARPGSRRKVAERPSPGIEGAPARTAGPGRAPARAASPAAVVRILRSRALFDKVRTPK